MLRWVGNCACFFVAVCAHVWSRCARVLFFPLLYVEQAQWLQKRITEHSPKHRAPAGLCVCVWTITLSSVTPSAKQKHAVPNHFLYTFPVPRFLPQEVTHLTTSEQLGSAWLIKFMRTCFCRLSKHGWAADSIGMMAVIFRPCILSLCSGRPTKKRWLTNWLMYVCLSVSKCVCHAAEQAQEQVSSLCGPCFSF